MSEKEQVPTSTTARVTTEQKTENHQNENLSSPTTQIGLASGEIRDTKKREPLRRTWDSVAENGQKNTGP